MGVQQVKDDFALLEIMLADMRAAPAAYQPGNYWRNYERIFVPELRKKGLRDFRRRGNTVLSTFGATDYAPLTAAANKHPMETWHPAARKFKRFTYVLVRKIRLLSKIVGSMSSALTGASLDQVRALFCQYAACYGEKNNAMPLTAFDASTAGNPEDVFPFDGHTYTTSLLNYYLYYAYCCRYVSFDSIGTLMELGPGSGKQIEVIRKLHGQLSFYLFDVPPQLYVCERYLATVFPGSVVSYRETRGWTEAPAPEAGKIYIFGTWKLPEVKNLRWELFWNCASFQEMEPDLVLNYLSFVNRQTQRYVFLQELMRGQIQAPREGEHGVLAPTTQEHYVQGLPDFEIADLSPSPAPRLRQEKYSCTFWKKKDAK
jgi:putative sugar O-methyltransferase